MKGEIAVRYTIRHFDLPLFTFEANMDSADTGLHFIKVYEENRSFLPLNLTVSEDGVERWLRHRAIPKNRAYVDALLSSDYSKSPHTITEFHPLIPSYMSIPTSQLY